MQTTGKETGHYEVDQGFDARKLVESTVENELDNDVDSMPSGGRLGAYETRSEGVKQNLEGTMRKSKGWSEIGWCKHVPEEGLASDVVQEEEFKTGGEVSVHTVFAQLLVVVEVVFLKTAQ